MDVTRGLDLSARQNAQIDSILNENHLNIEKMAGEFHDTMESFLEKQSSQIKQVLTEEQQQEFDRRYDMDEEGNQHYSYRLIKLSAIAQTIMPI